MEQEISVIKYVFRFAVAYLVLLVVLGVLAVLLNMDSNTGASIGALVASAIMVISKFVQENKRIPSVSEKKKLVWFSYLACWAVSIVLFAVFIVISGEVEEVVEFLTTVNMPVAIGAIVFVSIFYLGILDLSYGYMARKQFEGLRKKGKI